MGGESNLCGNSGIFRQNVGKKGNTGLIQHDMAASPTVGARINRMSLGKKNPHHCQSFYQKEIQSTLK